MSVQASTSWSFQRGTNVVPNNLDVPIYPWFPDAHIAMVKKNDEEINDPNSAYIMFWAGDKNYRSVGGPTPYPEDQKMLDPQEPVFGGRFDADVYNDGGSWMNSVFRKADINNNTSNTNRLIGFYHAEDHWPKIITDGIYAWKSMGVAISLDEGYTWQDMGQMITPSESKPETPQWGGTGDGTVIWHEVDQRWICFYSSDGSIQMAMSEDRDGAPGTWLKHYNGTFSQPGLGGLQTPIDGLQNVRGANPSVHFNTYLGLWMIVYHSWEPGCIYMSSSIDAYDWSAPQQVLCSPHEGGKTWYPTIIGESDVLAGETARLYYASFRNNTRDFIGEDISFTRMDEAVLAAEKLPVVKQPSSHTTSVTSDLSVAENEPYDLSSSTVRTATTTTDTVTSKTLPSAEILDSETSGSDDVATPRSLTTMMMLGSTLLGVYFFIIAQV